MLIAETLSEKLPPWPVTMMIGLASVVAFIGLAASKRFSRNEVWTKSRNQTFESFTLYLGSFVTALLMTFVLGDFIAIDSMRLEEADYAYSQRVEGVCVFALFFTIFFGNTTLNKITRLRLIGTLVSSAILATCLVIIHSAK
jgi:hypothetical protein